MGWVAFGWMGYTPAKVVKLILKDYVDVFKARSDKIWLHQAVTFVSCIGFGRVGSVTVSRWVGLDRVTQNGRVDNSAIDPILSSWSPFLGSLINLAAITVERYLKV